MERHDIRAADDVVRIEARPYERFMRHTSVHDGLDATFAQTVRTGVARDAA